MKNKHSTQKGEKDAKQKRISDLVLAGPYSPEESSFQDERYATKKSPEAERRSTLHCARKARNKANVHKEECDQYSSGDDSNEYKNEIEPGAYNVARTHSENSPDQEPQPTIDGSYMVDDDVKETAMLVEADLAPELTLAEEVNIQEQEAVIAKKIQYRRALRVAIACYGLANIGNIVGFVLLFLDLPNLYAFIPSACLFFIGTLSIRQETTTSCCASTVTLEQCAPDDTELLRETSIASVSSLCLFTFVAIPIIGTRPDFRWLGYAFMAWYFAGTVFTFSRIRLLRRSKETRQKKPKLFWIIFLAFFLGLSGLTIGYLWSPPCNVPNQDWIGNGVCDGEPYASEACYYDGFDCIQVLFYPDCIVDNINLIGNGVCDGEAYNSTECGYDGGDCVNNYPDCIVPDPSRIGDGECDGRVYGTVECGLDGGDCLGTGERCRGDRECASEVCNTVTKVCDAVFVSELYPNCSVSIPDWIGDGECDGGYYASEACGFDGGDCLKLDEPCLQDDECASGFCNAETKVCYLGTLEIYPDCVVEYPVKLGDGKCDGGAYETEACGYDDGDCINASV